jgi:hypothetical protein
LRNGRSELSDAGNAGLGPESEDAGILYAPSAGEAVGVYSQLREAAMSTSAVRIDDAKVATVDMKFEVVVIPVSDVDRAKKFYEKFGWRLDAD